MVSCVLSGQLNIGSSPTCTVQYRFKSYSAWELVFLAMKTECAVVETCMSSSPALVLGNRPSMKLTLSHEVLLIGTSGTAYVLGL